MNLLRHKKQKESAGRNPRGQVDKAAPVFSYYSKRSDEASTRLRSSQSPTSIKSRSVWLLYLPSLVALTVVVAASMYVTTLATQARVVISSDHSQHVALQPVTVYEQAAEKIMHQSFTNRSKITINTVKVADALEAQFPELSDIVVTVPLFGRKPLIQAAPAKPALVLVSKQGSYIIDVFGRPILRADQLNSSTRDKLPLITDSSEAPIEFGRQLLTSELVSFVAALKVQFDAKNVEIDSYTFPTLANELHVKLAGKNFYLKFNTDGDARLQAGTYFAVQDRLDSESKVPSEYIDLRVEERAYYK